MDDAVRKKQKNEHRERYEKIAQKVGLKVLAKLVPAKRGQIIEALEHDEHLNSIALWKWDMLHYPVMVLVRKAFPKICWSISGSVCLLKHVAKHHTDLVDEKKGSHYRMRADKTFTYSSK